MINEAISASGLRAEHALYGLIIFQISSFTIAFFILVTGVLGAAPYGRYVEHQWWAGPKVPARLSWLVQECPAVLIPVIYVLASGHWYDMYVTKPTANSWLLLAVCIHYTYRSFIFPFLLRGSKPSSLLTTHIAMVVCSVSGLIHALAFVQVLAYPPTWTSSPQFIIGLVLFFAGLLLNIHADGVLRNLRKPGETGYKIPRGGLFEYVSCANYFGEIVEWSGLALAGCSVPSSVMVVITLLNLVPRATTHHAWYKQKFEDYPSERAAIIPFIF
ncbi:3-oxo-5-alpha-steroid 4-dehydrogenase 1-like [Sycon ciliatum]|uniref:3-oxo-5-alpha-steroid 4-dehydrogenase 1-like n=1 Tax=Sycon ciliatum TaxID=27933 RepID=UPI0020AA3B18|eukprot:scpid91855/ scgid5856/ 3-oxo-5-alpha-steroid 4-dehydrogenase 1; SR type 1; Steroid 5-alpha-reductase 1